MFLLKTTALGISDQSTFNHFISAVVKFTLGECRCSLPIAERCNNVWKKLCKCVYLQILLLCLKNILKREKFGIVFPMDC